MLHTRSQGHWPLVPENKLFKGFFFTLYGHGDHLSHVIITFVINLLP